MLTHWCLQGTPTQSKPNTSRRSTRRRYGPGFIRHRDGPYDFRAHYGHGRVEFTVTYNPLNEGRPWGKLCDAVDTVFVRLRNAHFNIEPAEEPARWLRDQYWLARFESVRFSLDVRQIRAPVKQPKSAGAGSQVCKAEKDEQKDDKTKLTFLTFVPSTANGKQEVSCPVDTKNYGDLLPSSVSPPAGLEQENMLPSDVKKDDMEFGLVPSSPIIKQESDLKFGF